MQRSTIDNNQTVSYENKDEVVVTINKQEKDEINQNLSELISKVNSLYWNFISLESYIPIGQPGSFHINSMKTESNNIKNELEKLKTDLDVILNRDPALNIEKPSESST